MCSHYGEFYTTITLMTDADVIKILCICYAKLPTRSPYGEMCSTHDMIQLTSFVTYTDKI